MIVVQRLLIFLLLTGCVPSHGWAQFSNDFESGPASWQRSETDCIVKRGSWNQKRYESNDADSGFERIEFFVAGQGTRVFAAHSVPPALVISELQPSVRVRSPRPGARLYVRVVLPDTPSPKGDGPMTCLLRGPVYQNAGRWQTLSFARSGIDLAEKLREEIWVLKSRHKGREISRKGAYVDKVAVNMYQGAGQCQIDIDDLRLDGRVAATPFRDDDRIRDSRVAPTVFQQQEKSKPEALVTRKGTVVMAKGKPFFPRIIQHNGEPFDFLKALGFNVIELQRTATYEQLRQASQLDIWLICPPPATVGLKEIPFHFDRVLAWSVGQGLTRNNLASLEQRIREIRESDSRYNRLVMGNAKADWSQIASLADVLNGGLQPIGTSFLASQYSDWIIERRRSMDNPKPFWADIQTELSESLESQIKLLTPQPPPLPIEPQQIKFLVYEAIVGGARGMRFRSRNRLDGVDPVTMLRTLTLRWVNAELDLLEPWVVGGALMGPLPAPRSHPNLEVTAFNTGQARLLLIQRPTHHEQYVAGDQPPSRIVFRDAESPFTDNAYLIGQSALATLANTRELTGTEIKIDACPYVAAVVLTQDPRVVNRLSQGYQRQNSESMFAMHQQLVKQWLAIQQLINEQMGKMGRGTSAASSAMNDAVYALRNSTAMTEQSNFPSAEQYMNIASQRLALARREWVTEPLGRFQSKTSSPLTVHCSLVPLHWELVSRLGQGTWNPNGLGGGDFEDLMQMQNQGWQNRRRQDAQLVTRVELARESAYQGTYGLKLTVSAANGRPKLVESSPLVIESPAIPVRGGQLVRIHGWIKIPEMVRGSMDGLKISDSLTGEAMAERIPLTQEWQEFALYRSVPANGNISVRFELVGIGTAFLDEVTIRTINIPQAANLREAKRQ